VLVYRARHQPYRYRLGGRMYAGECPAPSIVELGVLLVIPAVYLGLMYLTFVSQD
jgi:hypothetical protein